MFTPLSKERERIKYVNIQPYKLLFLSDWLGQKKLWPGRQSKRARLVNCLTIYRAKKKFDLYIKTSKES
jgi:hypothetical protein